MNELPDTLPCEYIIKAIHTYDAGFSGNGANLLI